MTRRSQKSYAKLLFSKNNSSEHMRTDPFSALAKPTATPLPLLGFTPACPRGSRGGEAPRAVVSASTKEARGTPVGERKRVMRTCLGDSREWCRQTRDADAGTCAPLRRRPRGRQTLARRDRCHCRRCRRGGMGGAAALQRRAGHRHGITLDTATKDAFVEMLVHFTSA